MLLGNTPQEAGRFHLRDCHPLRPDFPDCSATPLLYHSTLSRQRQQGGPSTPHAQRLPAITRMRFSLIPFRSPLLRKSRLLSLPAGTEMFHFPALPPAALCIQAGATAHHGRRVSPFGNPRITAWLPAPRGISQAPASFIGSWYQGIHRVPLKTWHNKKSLQIRRGTPRPPKGTNPRREKGAPGIRCSRPLCSSQETDSTTAATPLRETTATACNEDPGANARILRTQQRAHPEPVPPPPFRTPKGTY